MLYKNGYTRIREKRSKPCLKDTITYIVNNSAFNHRFSDLIHKINE